MKNHIILLQLVSVVFIIFAVGCGKNEEKLKISEKPNLTELKSEKSKELETLKFDSESLKIVPDPKPSADSFLPDNYNDWEEFEQKNIAFRKKRAAAQNALPINEDGRRVWLGQIVYTNDRLDNQIKTFAMSRKLVKGNAECSFMKMDGTKIAFDDSELAIAIGKLAAKKYVKIFGKIDDDGVIYNTYISVGGMNYIFQNGELVKESERVNPQESE